MMSLFMQSCLLPEQNIAITAFVENKACFKLPSLHTLLHCNVLCVILSSEIQNQESNTFNPQQGIEHSHWLPVVMWTRA